MRIRVFSIVLVAGLALAATSASACGDEPAVNLVASSATKSALRAAYLRAHRSLVAGDVVGPVRGATYYGSYGGTEFAVATFASNGGAFPTIFERTGGAGWRAVRDTHGGICTNWVPLELIEVWSLRHWGGRCFVAP